MASSSNKTVLLMVILGAAAGLGFAIYYLMVLGPAGERRVTTQQIEEWASKKWYPARACLVGDEPKATTGYDAVVLRSAIPGDAAPVAGECRAFFLDLRRPGEVSSGNARVEAAWKDVEEAVAMLANAYAPYEPSKQTDREALGTALDRVDAAYARLRADAGLGSSTAQSSKLPAIAEPSAATLSHNGEPIEVFGIDLFGHALAVHGAVADSKVTALVRNGASVRVLPLRGAARPAAADSAWGVWSETPADGRVELRAGPLTPEGAPAAAGVPLIATRSRVQVPSPVFALGEGKERLVLIDIFDERADTGEYWAAGSHDDGATWPERVRLPTGTATTVYTDWIRRRVDLAWADPTGRLWWLGLDAKPTATAAQARELFAAPTPSDGGPGAGEGYVELRRCASGENAWWLALGDRDQSRLVVAGLRDGEAAKPVAGAAEISVIAACDDERLLGLDRSHQPARLILCTQTACEPAFEVPRAGDAQLAATLAGDGRPVAATVTNDLLVLWRSTDDGDAQRIYRVPDIDLAAGDLLRALVVWEGVLHAVLASSGQARFLPLPLD